ncbi:amino acid adenylation domain-containing protein [Tumebacillus sp. BK434]|uniref:non-ribosomal peptide synthetase n=1 Tax=Tumebacillus sp. BK434 TaxID=2512169 RepID=UPI00104BEB90|nr:non-ribosomal peptide synthetase [Tumebacillus sp. BK434]TCP59138.1 amino acid adenylation domain-containing protein [Tumebacillus sp. BK434]
MGKISTKQEVYAFPASLAQQRLWFLNQIIEDRSAYNLPAALRFRGDLNVDCLERSLDEIVRRHETLRTSFEIVEDQLMQMVQDKAEWNLEVVDLCHLLLSNQEELVLSMAAEEARRVFDLSAGPLLRTTLLKLRPDEHVLLITMHHIVSDGWSVEVFMSELMRLYEALTTGRPIPLSELEFQYADYTHFHHEFIESEEVENQVAYWKEHLSGRSTVLQLPTDHPRPSRQSYKGATVPVIVPPKLTDQLKELCKREGVTLFMVLLAAYQALIYRHTRQEDILVGSPYANRDMEEVEGMIGLFVNTLVFASRIDEETQFSDLLLQVRQSTIDAMKNQEVPFERLLEELKVEREMSHSPIFQVMFAMQNSSLAALRLPGVEIEVLPVERGTAKFDLLLDFAEVEGALVGTLEYSTDLFEHQTVDRMSKHFCILLEGAIQNPNALITELPMLTSAEEHQLLVEWNDTKRKYELANDCLHELFEKQVERNPDSIAVTFQGNNWTYQELNRRSNRLAHRLQRLGVGSGTFVGVSMERSLELVASLLAILKTGAAYVPLDPELPTDRLSYILKDSAVQVLITERRIEERIQELDVPRLFVGEMWEELEKESEANPSVASSSETLCYMIYTSGSTGRPKGAMNAHRGVVNRLLWMQETFQLTAEDRILQKTPFGFDVSVWEFFWPLITGARLVMAIPEGHKDPEYLTRMITEEKITTIHFVPSMLYMFLESDQVEACTSLRTVICSGEALTFELQERFFERLDAELHNLYGPTEAAIDVTHWACQRESEHRVVPIGRPVANTQLYILDPHLKAVPIGVAGELYIGGVQVGIGYHGRPDLTEHSFLPDPFRNEPGARLYKTGDLARYLNDGTIEYLGRVDFQVKIRGFRVELGEIEALLDRHPQIGQSVVTAFEEDGHKRLIAYVVVEKEAVSEDDLRNYLKQQLPEYMVPSAWVMMQSLPLSPNGKIDRRSLPNPILIHTQRERVAPRNEVEQKLADVWGQVLHIKQVGIDDNYFEVGGDSIRSIQVVAMAKKKGLVITLRDILACQTIRELALVATSMATDEPEAASMEPFALISSEDRLRLPETVENAYPLTKLQEGMLFHSSFDPDSYLYLNLISVHLRSMFDQEVFEKALRWMAKRHPAFRTSFDLIGNEQPLQLIHRDVAVNLHVEDLRNLTDAEQQEHLKNWLQSQRGRSFDWAQAPLIRCTVHLRGDDRFQFTLNEHHALYDGWSMSVLLVELFNTYFSLQNKQLSERTDLPWLFQEYVALEGLALQSEEQRGFWKSWLDGAQITKLPRLTNAPAQKARVNICHRVRHFSEEFSKRLKDIAHLAGTPLRTVLFAAHLRVLNLISGQNDLVTGVVNNGRPEVRESEKVLGLFLNTLPYRAQLDGGTWLDLIRQCLDLDMRVLPFRRYPLAQLQVDHGGEALFETAFNFTHFHVLQSVLGIEGMEVLDVVQYADTNLPFLAEFSQDLFTSQVKLSLQWDMSEFDEQMIARMETYYANVLEQMVRDPEARYEQVSLLSAEESDDVFHHWNDTDASLEIECLHQLFSAKVPQFRDKIAVKAPMRTLSYEELYHQSNRVAHLLREQGAQPNRLVAVMMEKGWEQIVAVLGVLQAGAAYLPIDPSLPRERIRYLISQSEVELILTQSYVMEKFGLLTDVTTFCIDQEELFAGYSIEPPIQVHGSDDLAYVIFTSGSTGVPKGVMITHRGAVNTILDINNRFGVTEKDSVLAMSMLEFDLSVYDIFGLLGVGGTIVFPDAKQMHDPAHWSDVLLQEQITLWNSAPTMMKILVDHLNQTGASLPSSMRLVLLSGDWIPITLPKQIVQFVPAVQVVSLGGATEASIWSILYPIGEIRPEWSSIPYGRPMRNQKFYVLDQALQPCPVGTPGELYIGGTGLAIGYWKDDEKTRRSFIQHPQTGERLYRTGDMGRYQLDGTIEFLGRVDFQVKIRGFRVELGEIETVLSKHDLILETVVVVREDEPGDRRLVAYIQPLQGAEIEPADLRMLVREALPNYMVPSAFVFLEQWPMTNNGKLDRKALPAPEIAGRSSTHEFVAPRNELEEQLSEIWTDVLKVESVGMFDNFFDIGGHSLLAMQLMTRVTETFHVQLPLRTMFEAPSVAELADKIRHAGSSEEESVTIALVPRGEGLPLSPAQERLWFLEQLEEEGNSAYHISDAVRIAAPLELDVLQKSLNLIVSRHETLRTSFRAFEGTPQQFVEERDIPIRFFDVRDIPLQVREQRIKELAKEDAQTRFDLEHDPLLRMSVLREADEEYLLVLTMHHIISDAWSMGIFITELLHAYESILGAQTPTWPDLSVQYADYASWHREWLKGEQVSEQLEYWKRKLGDRPTVLELPTDHPRQPVRSTRGRSEMFNVSKQVVDRFAELGQKEQATLFMTMLTAFKVWLYRYTGQADLSVGTPIANRSRLEWEGLIGFFVNTLVIRTSLSGKLNFGEIVSQVREIALEAYSNQDVPFERLVEDLQPERNLSYTPLFQVMFVLQKDIVGETDSEHLTLTPLGAVETETSKFDLTMVLTETQQGLSGVLEYSTDLFEESTVKRMVKHFNTLLEAIILHPDLPIEQISFMSAEETDWLLAVAKGREIEHQPGVMLHQMFERQVEKTPDAVAVAAGLVSLTYRELNDRANRLAHYLRRIDVTPDEPVGLYMERSPELVVAIYAVLKAGGAYVPIDPTYPEERITYMLQEANVRVLLTQDDLPKGEEWTAVEHLIQLDAKLAWLQDESTDNPVITNYEEDLAYIIYTSGSTGNPKGVMIEHRALRNHMVWMQRQFTFTSQDVILQKTPISFDASVWEFHAPLLCGARLVLADPDWMQDLSSLVEVINREAVTVLQVVPSLLIALLADCSLDSCSTLRHVFCGGEVLTSELKKRFYASMNAELHNLYGPTEACIDTLWWDCDDSDEEFVVPIGRPVDNVQALVLDDQMQLVPIGVPGELYLGGICLARGYLNRPDLTAEMFVPNHFGEGRLYKTGDMVRIRENGTLLYLGRRDHQVKIRGLRIELEEIQSELLACEGVQEAIVLVREGRYGDPLIVAYFVPSIEGIRTAALRESLRLRLPEYMIPNKFMQLEALPLHSNGKINRNALPVPDFDPLERTYEALRTDTERLVAAIWFEVLGVEKVGRRDSFFELGGHSLLAAKLRARFLKKHGIDFPLRTLFDKTTVESFAAYLDEQFISTDGYERIEGVAREPYMSLSFGQRRLWFLEQFEPGTAAYNMPSALRIHGSLDAGALEQSFAVVMSRHEVLRTQFVVVDHEPKQQILADVEVPFRYFDVSDQTAEDQNEFILRMGQTEAAMPFDLEQAPLLRIVLIRLDEQEHVLFITLHHIISDGVSNELFIRELTALYQQFVEGTDANIPELPIQYADYSHWLRDWMQGDVMERDLAYWKQQLEGPLPILQLPTDRPRPAVRTSKGKLLSYNCSEVLYERLMEMSQREGVTLFMSLLTAFKTLMYRYTGEEDLVVGTPIVNRDRPEIESLIGFFVNTLAIRTSVHPDLRLREMLAQMRNTMVDAYTHQHLPFEHLVDSLNVERHLSHTPLFQVMFNHLNEGEQVLNLSDLRFERIEQEITSTKFDLTLYAIEGAGGIRFELLYNTDLFTEERMHELMAQYVQVLKSMVEDLEMNLIEIDLVTDSAKRVLPNPKESLAAAPQIPIHDGVIEQVKRVPNHVAIIDGKRSWTYEQLHYISNGMAADLLGHGIGRDSVVAIYADRSAELVAAMLAVLKIGAAFVILDATYPAARIIQYLEEAAPQGWISLRPGEDVPAELRSYVQGQAYLCQMEINDALVMNKLMAPLMELPVLELSASDVAYIAFTSGTTGTPKAICGTHAPVSHFLNWYLPTFKLNETDRFSMLSGLAHDPLLRDVFAPLWLGATLCIPDPSQFGEPDWLVDWLLQSEISVTHVTPAMCRLITESQPNRGSAFVNQRLRYAFIGGDRLTLDVVERLRGLAPEVRCINFYGTTETPQAMGWHEVDQLESHQEEARLEWISVGRGIDDVQLLVLNKDWQLAGIGEPGELFVRTPYLSQGYLNATDETTKRFVRNPFTQLEGDRLYKTGDLGYYRPDGTVVVVGRADRQVKIRGFRIETAEIEAVLKESLVRDAFVLERTVEGLDSELVAYVVLHDELEEWKRQIFDGLWQRLPDYMVPRYLVRLDALPLTPNGKIDAASLPDPVQEELGATEYVAPRTEVEARIEKVWAEVLRLEHVGMYDRFFERGGNSLLATQVIVRIREQFQVDLPLRNLFEHPTVAGLAEQVELRLHKKSPQQDIPLVPVVRTTNEFDLADTQRRMWFLYQLDPSSAAYNIPVLVRIVGSLNREALIQSTNEIVQRHEILRAQFYVRDGRPVQTFRKGADVQFDVINLVGVDQAEREARAELLIHEEVQRPFDLSKDLLIRAKLVQIASEEHIVIVTMHHIVADGWSIGRFIGELSILYRARIDQKTPDLQELSVQYADYVHWQHQWLLSEGYTNQLSYWQQQLAGAATTLELRTDFPRPAMQTFRGQRINFHLSPELTAGITMLGYQSGTTLFMTLMAAFQSLLYRYSGQLDILTGSPIANRTKPELEDLIGFFANVLVFRTDLSGNPSFRELLGRVRDVALEAYAHQDLPYERLIEHLPIERELSRNPLFQVMFVLQNATLPEIDSAGVTLSGLQVERGTAKFDITLTMMETEAGMIGEWEYNADLYENTTMQRMVTHFITLLEGVATDPDRTISEYRLLDEAELYCYIKEWNATDVPFPDDKCVHHLFEEQVLRTPDHPAVVFGALEITYRELNERANQLAHHLLALGCGADQIVGVLMERSIDLVVALLGILKAGSAYLPIDLEAPELRIQELLESANATVCVTQQHLQGKLPVGVTGVQVDADWTNIETYPTDTPATSVTSEHLVSVYYTSGSTGKPKGVANVHRGWVNRFSWMQRKHQLQERETVLHKTTLTFDDSAVEIFWTLAYGGRIAVLEKGEHRDPRAILAAAIDYQVAVLQFVPSMLGLVLDLVTPEHREQLANLRVVVSSGEALRPELVRKFMDRMPGALQNSWGATEVSIDSTNHTCTEQDLQGHDYISIGKPFDNNRIYILDQLRQPVPIGVEGDIYIAGAGLARGYFGDPKRTAESFIPDPFVPGEKMYFTGDRGLYRAEGSIIFLGRKDDQVKVRGMRVELGEIESTLDQHPFVQSCVLTIRSLDSGDKQLVAYVVLHNGCQVQPGELRDFLRARLPEYMVPSYVVIMGMLPFTPNGKIDRRALPNPDEQDFESGVAYVGPRDRIEYDLVTVFSELFNGIQVSVKDSFFDLGGHSLLAVRAVARLESEQGYTLPLSAFFQHNSVEELAVLIRNGGDAAQGSHLLPLQTKGSKVPFFCVHPALGTSMVYLEMARFLEDDQPFYCFQSNGLEDDEESDKSIQEMAERYIRELRHIQPDGPYRIGGYCMGGLIAYEMAQQLRDQGQEVEKLIMIDTLAPEIATQHSFSSQWEFALWVAQAQADLYGVTFPDLSSFNEVPYEEALAHLLDLAKQHHVLPKDVSLAQFQRFLKVYRANEDAEYAYQVKRYQGTVTLLNAADQPQRLQDYPYFNWEKWVDGYIEFEIVPGDHNTMMMSPNVQTLATKLNKLLGNN